MIQEKADVNGTETGNGHGNLTPMGCIKCLKLRPE